MARPLRLDIPDGIHHVTARGNARGLVYVDEIDRLKWNEVLTEVTKRFGWIVLAYCQMTNHYHLLVETPEPNLSRGMRQLNGVYAQRFNRRHDRVGHVFQARFSGTLIQREEHLVNVAAYIARNPVVAGLCEHPGDWSWSSYRATVGLEPPGFVAVHRLLGFFGERSNHTRDDYRLHAEQRCEDPFADVDGAVILGSDDFVKTHTAALEQIPEVPRRHWQPTRPPLERFVTKRSNASIAAAYMQYGYTMLEIAEHLGLHYATVSRRIRVHEAMS